MNRPLEYHPTLKPGPAAGRVAPPGTVMWITVVGISILFALLHLQMKGVMIPTLSLGISLTVIIVSFYRIDWGFNIFLGAVLVMDQFHLLAGESLTYKVAYFLNLKENPYLPSVAYAVVNPMELHLLLIILIWVILIALKKQREFAAIPSWVFLSGFVGWIAISFVHGLATGGDSLAALWEVRAIAYFAIIFALTPQIIHNREQVRNIFWVFIIAISIKAFQGILRFLENGAGFGGADLLTNSEDPVFMITLILFLIILVLLRVKDRQRGLLAILLLPLLLGVYVGQRRATYVSFIISIVVLAIMLPPQPRKRLLTLAAVIVVLFGIYLAAYWNTWGRIGVIAQQFKSIIGADDPTLSGVDYYSNLYRDYENFNLATTIQREPITGIGFGKAYDTPLLWFDMLTRYKMLKYVPHNSMLWIFCKTGAIGFFFFLTFFNVLIFKYAFTARRLKDPYLKAVGLVCLLAIFNQLSVSYVEMQLSFYRNMIYLACMTSLVGVLPTIDLSTEAAAGASEGSPHVDQQGIF